jgi:hypothetical protein
MPVGMLKIMVDTKYIHEEVVLEFCQYDNKRTAIRAYALDGDPMFTATVNIPNETPAKDCVFLKGWSENEGLPEALVKAGVVKLTGRKVTTGYTEAVEAKILQRPGVPDETQAFVDEYENRDPDYPDSYLDNDH